MAKNKKGVKVILGAIAGLYAWLFVAESNAARRRDTDVFKPESPGAPPPPVYIRRPDNEMHPTLLTPKVSPTFDIDTTNRTAPTLPQPINRENPLNLPTIDDIIAKTAIGGDVFKTPAHGLQYENLFIKASEAYGLPPGLLSRVAQQESSYNKNAYNKRSGASGLMQIVPRWHPDAGDPFDPAQAIPYAAKYLRSLYNRFGTWEKALAAYNWGQGNLSKALANVEPASMWRGELPTETFNYITKIKKDTGIV